MWRQNMEPFGSMLQSHAFGGIEPLSTCTTNTNQEKGRREFFLHTPPAAPVECSFHHTAQHCTAAKRQGEAAVAAGC